MQLLVLLLVLLLQLMQEELDQTVLSLTSLFHLKQKFFLLQTKPLVVLVLLRIRELLLMLKMHLQVRQLVQADLVLT